MIRSKQDKYFEAAACIIMTVVMILVLFPFLLLFMSSITEESSLLINGYSIFPKEFSLGAYSYIWQSRDTIFRAYITTICITAVGTCLNVLITALVAYPLSLDYLPGKKIFSFLLLFTMLFNGGLVPTYMVYTTVLHIKNTYFALLMPNLLFSAFNAIIVRTYLRCNIPQELYESARIDGAGEVCVFFRIGLPLGRGGILSAMTLGFLEYWNLMEQPLAFLESKELWPLSLYLPEISWQQAGYAFAASLITLIPPVFVFLMGQEYLEQGIVYAGLKG